MLRIEIVRTAENLGRDLVLLQRRSGMIERVLSQIAQQFAEGFRPVKHLAVDQLVNLPQAPLSFETLRARNRHLT